MKNRTKFITVVLLVASMVLTNLLPVMGMEITEDTVEVQSVNEEVTIDSVDDAEAHLDWVDVEYPDKNYSGLPYPFGIINDSDKGETVSFSRILEPRESDSNVLLVSYTNGYSENLALTAVNKNAKELWVYNEGTVVVSDNNPIHSLAIEGYDGHGETFYINKNMLGLTDDEVDNLKLNEVENKHYPDYVAYSLIPECEISTRGYNTYNAETGEDIPAPHLIVKMEIIHDNFDPTQPDYKGAAQTWIKITFDGQESDSPKEVEVPEWQKNGFKREFLNDNGDYIETVSSSEFVSKKVKPIVTLSYNGQTYTSGKGGRLVVSYKNNKNAGQATITLKKVKKDKSLTRIIKGKTITFEIAPVTVSDNNIQLKIKNGKVKSVKVMTGGKYKKVKKTMWSLNGNVLNFTGNYTGSVSLNNIS